MQKNELSANGQKLLTKIEFDDKEELVYEVRKHPFGLFAIYFTGFFVAAVLFIALVAASAFLKEDPLELGISVSTLQAILILLAMFLGILSLSVTFIAGYLYKSNVVIITNEKLAQFLYTTIFDRKISQLSIGDVQDVTVSQKGLFARLFGYGTLTIETAGEQRNLVFTFTPNPYEASKAIVGAHEENLKLYGN